MDQMAMQSSPIHALHPLSKLLTCIAYIFLTASFPKYQLSGLIVMLLYPVLLFTISGISMRSCFVKLAPILPLVCAVGIANPFFDTAPILSIGNIAISGGVISMITLLLKGIFCLMASFLLVATTSIDALCAAFRKLHIPNILVTLLLLTYRYIAVMLHEISIMTIAYKLRAPGQKGLHISSWGSFLGQLLLRSMDRAEEIYSSMQLRGFHGEFWYAQGKPFTVKDFLYLSITIVLLVICRYYDIAELLGNLITVSF